MEDIPVCRQKSVLLQNLCKACLVCIIHCSRGIKTYIWYTLQVIYSCRSCKKMFLRTAHKQTNTCQRFGECCCAILPCTVWKGCSGWWKLNVTHNFCHLQFLSSSPIGASKRSWKFFEGLPASCCLLRNGDIQQYCAALEEGQAKRGCNYSSAPASAVEGLTCYRSDVGRL